jgi:oligopeptide transport system substrate-binding protein
MAITEPTAIDPYRVQEIEGIGITKQLYAGLLRVERGQLAPGLAESWRGTDGGRTWTFRLRAGTRFSDGEPVDAAAVLRGLNRALDPEANTETAYHVAGVRGFGAVRDGTAATLAGLSAPDDRTVRFELAEPDAEFDQKTVQPIFSPVPSVAGRALDPEFNDRPIGNGPYMLDEPWRHGKSITLVRNPYWSGPVPAVGTVAVDIVAPGAEYAGFEAGRYDYARVPADRVAAARAHPGFLEQDLPGLHYLIPFCHRPPMDSVGARRAVSAAIDRAGISERLFGGSRVPAGSLVSPWFADVHRPGLGAPYTDFDPELARRCAAEAGLVPGDVLTLATNPGAGHDAWVAAVADGLRAVLGLDVRLHETTTAGLVEHRTSEKASGLCRAGWAYDYPTPDNLLFPLLHSSCTAPDAQGTAHGDNEGRYADPRFDAAVALARAATDPAERARRWQDAEGIAMDGMALIPLWYRTEHRVVATDRFAGLDLDFFGNPTIAELRPAALASP